MTTPFKNGRRMILVLLASVSVNLFLLGGLASFYFFGHNDHLQAMDKGAGKDRAVPPPVRAMNRIIEAAYPNLSDQGRQQIREVQNRIYAAMDGMSPTFPEHRDRLLDHLSQETPDPAHLEGLVGEMMEKRGQMDVVMMESLKHIAVTMSPSDRQVLAEAMRSRLGRR